MRKPKPRPIPESLIARQVAGFLEVALPAGAKFSHIPNGGHRTKAAAGKLRAEGVRPGVPDVLILVPDVGTIWVELKNSAGRLSPHQEEWAETIRRTPRAAHFVCRSVEEVESALLSCGVPLRATISPKAAHP